MPIARTDVTNLLGNERSRGRAASPLVQSTTEAVRERRPWISAHVWSPALLLGEAGARREGGRPAHGGQRGATRSRPPGRAAGLQRLLVACRGVRRAATEACPVLVHVWLRVLQLSSSSQLRPLLNAA